MHIDASGVLGAIVVVPMLLWTGWLFVRPVAFRRLQLPRLASRNGWLVRNDGRGPRDLPGDGGQGWETPLPDTVVEFLGRYRGRPVHGVQVSVRKGTHLLGATGQRTPAYTSYTVVSTALTDRPFDGFHDRDRGPARAGDPMGLYQDFAEWARNRRPEVDENVRQEGSGLRSISWRGRMTRKRLLRALDELTAG